MQEKKWQFITEAQAVIHGDLHTGSVMVTETETRVIDPEFAFVGPMAFDVGAIIANYLLSFFAHAGRDKAGPIPIVTGCSNRRKSCGPHSRWSSCTGGNIMRMEKHSGKACSRMMRRWPRWRDTVRSSWTSSSAIRLASPDAR